MENKWPSKLFLLFKKTIEKMTWEANVTKMLHNRPKMKLSAFLREDQFRVISGSNNSLAALGMLIFLKDKYETLGSTWVVIQDMSSKKKRVIRS